MLLLGREFSYFNKAKILIPIKDAIRKEKQRENYFKPVPPPPPSQSSHGSSKFQTLRSTVNVLSPSQLRMTIAILYEQLSVKIGYKRKFSIYLMKTGLGYRQRKVFFFLLF
jgi:hypothetical protein